MESKWLLCASLPSSFIAHKPGVACSMWRHTLRKWLISVCSVGMQSDVLASQSTLVVVCIIKQWVFLQLYWGMPGQWKFTEYNMQKSQQSPSAWMAVGASHKVADDHHDLSEKSSRPGHVEDMKPFGGYWGQIQHQNMSLGVDWGLCNPRSFQAQNTALEYEMLSSHQSLWCLTWGSHSSILSTNHDQNSTSLGPINQESYHHGTAIY